MLIESATLWGMPRLHTIHGKYLVGKSFGERCRLKLLATNNLANKLQSVHMRNAFLVYL